MGRFQHRITHGKTKEEALQRVKALLSDVEKNYAPMVSDYAGQWNDNRFDLAVNAMGQRFTGYVLVEEHDLLVECEYSLMASIFAPRIEEAVTRGLQHALK